MEETKMQICSKCKKELPLTEDYYYKDSYSSNGFRSDCKECVKSKYKKNDNVDIYFWYQNKSDKFKNKWSFSDIKWIFDNYLNINKQELINKFPNYSYKRLTSIVYEMGLKKINKNDIWSKEDIKFLKENYPNMPQTDLQKRFGDRTWHSIKIKASKLGVSRDNETYSKILSDTHKGVKLSEETRRKMSKRMRGDKSPNWKGGISPLHLIFRGMLYEWKFDSLKQYDFKCAILGIWTNKLEIHHVNENFSDLIIKTLEYLNLPIYKSMEQYSLKDYFDISKKFLELNYQSGLGIPLDRAIHKLYHKIYGTKNNNKEQFKLFVKRLENGEFNDFLEENKLQLKR